MRGDREEGRDGGAYSLNLRCKERKRNILLGSASSITSNCGSEKKRSAEDCSSFASGEGKEGKDN